ncbi:hypothetical protein EIN_173680 [Entamoeba invadens IP1]|uniref:Uncharacterized protein n=1 Tax=Entamoeba invadens IP1 TaxID=370355 RepID=A0A0A1U1B1_ENTIV|nr:hypothetical protein EIN_173680 [Entamoeba invadens IP1]ELP84693.1 hypothetical protein EIN_173680 [Entamoeba invadens IP1]|eukprot:XP_004184039.1 hypothetical protein EIN_173680 [Entamoeba invadens IP1]
MSWTLFVWLLCVSMGQMSPDLQESLHRRFEHFYQHQMGYIPKLDFLITEMVKYPQHFSDQHVTSLDRLRKFEIGMKETSRLCARADPVTEDTVQTFCMNVQGLGSDFKRYMLFIIQSMFTFVERTSESSFIPEQAKHRMLKYLHLLIPQMYRYANLLDRIIDAREFTGNQVVLAARQVMTTLIRSKATTFENPFVPEATPKPTSLKFLKKKRQ